MHQVTPPNRTGRKAPRPGQDLNREAERIVARFHHENSTAGPPSGQLKAIRRQVEAQGTYEHTPAELQWAARAAWRNSARCIGGLYWRSPQVRNRRDVRTADSIADEAVIQLRQATNSGRIRPLITIFAPDTPEASGPRILNPQLIRYAGYQQADGSVTGDPLSRAITQLAASLGWPGGNPPGPFDVLPLVIQDPSVKLTLYDLPPDAIVEIPLRHHDFDWFADLGLRWHAIPVISDMYLDAGGIRYPAAPFNGWYMCTEIGSRNLGDAGRYNQLPVIAERMGLDIASRTLWQDRAPTELNSAVLHSFTADGVTISDHRTESSHFLAHLRREELAGRACPADWTWIVPPAVSSATPVFHRYYDCFDQTPNFYRHLAQPDDSVPGMPGREP